MSKLGGTFKMAGKTIHRMGYGAMQLAGPGVFGPPKDKAAALEVLKEAIKLGINHVDTSDFYGPHITNQLIKEALHPYPSELLLVTKVGAKRTPDKAWPPALSREDLGLAIEDNIRNLGIQAVDVVNLRVGGMHGPNELSIIEPLKVLIELKGRGRIKHIGLSNISRKQYEECRELTEIACVQNYYNLVMRGDDPLIDDLASEGIAFVPFFPLGGFTPIQNENLAKIALELESTPQQVALAWLLQRAPNVLCIPGTSSIAHLHENVKAAELKIPEKALAELNAISSRS